MTERLTVIGLAAALGVVVDAPIEIESRKGDMRPDIVIGQGEARDVVEVKLFRGSMEPLTGALAQLGRYLDGFSGRFGALAIIEAIEREPDWQPAIQQKTTSSGKPAVVLML